MTTDPQMRLDVMDELRWEPAVNCSDIAVSTLNGVVTLTGTVPHYADKRVVERAVQRVEGVKAIVEELEVNLQGGHKRRDAEIADAVVSSLKWHVWIPDEIQATIENGWVTLLGIANWEYQRHAAECAVTYLPGVVGVTNNITLKPVVQAAAIKDLIEKALKRDAQIDSHQIRVSTDGSKVTLSGSIATWHQREEAGSTAWNAPGVTNVENNLAVVVS